MRWMRFLLDPDLEGGAGGAGGAGGEGSPGGEGAPGQAGGVPAGSHEPSAGQAGGDPGSTGGEPAGGGSGDGGGNNYVLLKLPHRESPEYAEAWENLSFEEQLQAEREFKSLREKANPELEGLVNAHLQKLSEAKGKTPETDKENEDPNKKPEGQDPGKPDSEDDKGGGEPAPIKITKEMFDKLEPTVQTAIKTMTEQIEELSVYESPEFKSGLELIEKDPVLTARIKDIQEGRVNPSDISSDIKKQFDPNELIEEDTFKNLGLDPKNPTALKTLSDLLIKSAQTGRDMSKVAYEAQSRIDKERLQLETELEKQYSSMANENPSMKSELDFANKEHPLAPFFKWTRDVGMNSKQIASIGMKNVYKSYLSATGNEEKLINKIASKTKQKVFLELEDLENEARNFNPSSQSGGSKPTGQMYKGIDLERYLKDPTYRQRQYEGAEFDTQLILERYAATGDPNIFKQTRSS